jgi:hypothetical protein
MMTARPREWAPLLAGYNADAAQPKVALAMLVHRQLFFLRV